MTTATQVQPVPTDIREKVVVVCAWCPELHIMKLERRASDVIEILQEGKRLIIRRNGMQLGVSHGICRMCSPAEQARVSEPNS